MVRSTTGRPCFSKRARKTQRAMGIKSACAVAHHNAQRGTRCQWTLLQTCAAEASLGLGLSSDPSIRRRLGRGTTHEDDHDGGVLGDWSTSSLDVLLDPGINIDFAFALLVLVRWHRARSSGVQVGRVPELAPVSKIAGPVRSARREGRGVTR